LAKDAHRHREWGLKNQTAENDERELVIAGNPQLDWGSNPIKIEYLCSKHEDRFHLKNKNKQFILYLIQLVLPLRGNVLT